MENLILLLVFIFCLCLVFVVADLYVTLTVKRKHTKHSKLNGFNYKL
jgi:hypothetical protein